MSILQRGETESGHVLHIPSPAKPDHGVPNTSKARPITQHEYLHLRHLTLKHHKLIGLGQLKQHAVHAVARGRQEAIAYCLQTGNYDS